MNQKFLKKIRAAVRQFYGDSPVRGHTTPKPNAKMIPDLFGGLNLDGTERQDKRPFVYTGTVRNAEGTQRRFYREAKKFHRQAGRNYQA